MLKKKRYIPEPVFWGLAVREASMSGLTIIAKARGLDSHPSEPGKRFTFVEWAAMIGGYLPSAIADEKDRLLVSDLFKYAGTAALAVHAKTGYDGVADLSRQAFAPNLHAE